MPLIPYWATRWLCWQCGHFETGRKVKPAATDVCPYCTAELFLVETCAGMTVRELPFATPPRLESDENAAWMPARKSHNALPWYKPDVKCSTRKPHRKGRSSPGRPLKYPPLLVAPVKLIVVEDFSAEDTLLL